MRFQRCYLPEIRRGFSETASVITVLSYKERVRSTPVKYPLFIDMRETAILGKAIYIPKMPVGLPSHDSYLTRLISYRCQRSGLFNF
jgi:hypothetical protein